ncbi:MAG: 50S ribosomal protein L29 [Thermoprotei archaeon]
MAKQMDELRKMDLADLQKELAEVRGNLFKERASIITKGGSKNTQSIRAIRAQISRIETVLSEKVREGKR